MSEKPTLLIRLMPDKSLKIKLPKKGARWQGGFKSVEEAVKKAMDEGLEPPFLIEYTDEDS